MIFHKLGLILNREVRRDYAPSKTTLLPRLRKKGVRLIHNNQKGFTMIEVVIAIAITAIITGSITMSIFQVFDGNIRSSNHMIAVRQVQNAGYWVSHDTLMAQSVVTDGGATGFPLTLTWTEYVSGDEHRVVYTLISTSLKREHYTNYDPDNPALPDTTTFAAEYINQADTSCSLTGGGTFTLPDKYDAFTITGGAVADSGKITVDPNTGSIKVTTSGSATYTASTDTWTTPDANGTVVVKADEDITAGVWTSTTANAKVAITTDDDGDAIITGHVLILTVTVTVGAQSETRTYEIIPRPGS